MKLRLCEPGDLSTLLDLGRQFHDELKENQPPLDEGKSLSHAAASIKLGLALGVETKKAELCGAFLMLPWEFWFSSHSILLEIGFFVRKDARKSRAAKLLIDGAKAIADDVGAPLYAMPLSGVDVERKDRLFERSGFVRVGSIYRWR